MEDIVKAYRERVQALNAQIDQGIETHRKADGMIRVLDRDGNPVAGAEVTVHQNSHDFSFGCNGLCIGQMGAFNEEYERKFVALFNTVTTTSCWSVTETKEGFFRFSEADGDLPRRPPLDRIVAFAKKHGLIMKGQPLMADSWWPQWTSRDPQKMMEQWKRFIEAVAERYNDSVDVWDVVNESMLCERRNPDFPLWTKDLDYVDACFAMALRVFPQKHGVFELNEATMVNDTPVDTDTYFNLAKRLLDSNLPLERIGFQFHMFDGESGIKHLKDEMLPLETIMETYHRFGKLGVPLSISEITVPSRLPGFTKEEGEALQAEMVHDLYRLWFSMLEIHSIIYWNFMDGEHWKKEGDCRGCLLDVNGCEKPSYQVLYQLIEREWKTRMSLVTNEVGEIHFRGFKGGYDVTIKSKEGRRRLNYGLHGVDSDALTVTL